MFGLCSGGRFSVSEREKGKWFTRKGVVSNGGKRRRKLCKIQGKGEDHEGQKKMGGGVKCFS